MEHEIGPIILTIVVAGSYFLPTLIAASKDHTDSVAVFLVNALLGWTVIGWGVALVWSYTDRSNSLEGPAKKTCPHCAVIILADSIFCRFCGREQPVNQAAEARRKKATEWGG